VLGEISLSNIDIAKVQELINSMMGNARGTRKNVVDDLLMILDEARKGHVVPNISKKDLKFGLKKPGEGKPFFFTPPQVKKILAHFAGRKIWDAFFTLLELSGLRASEILGLRVEDLDFDSSTIHVRQGIWHGQVVTTKIDESENSVPMTPTMKAKLQAHLVNHTHELAFVNRRNRPFSRNKVVQTVLQPALDKLGISRKGRRVGLHAFRHTLASMLLQTTGVEWRLLSGSSAILTLPQPWDTTGISWGTIIARRLKPSKRHFLILEQWAKADVDAKRFQEALRRTRSQKTLEGLTVSIGSITSELLVIGQPSQVGQEPHLYGLFRLAYREAFRAAATCVMRAP
jgi:Phage integrase family